MSERKHLLTSVQMAEFVHNGFLKFDAMVPKDICKELYTFIDTQSHPRAVAPSPFFSAFPEDHPLMRAYSVPALRGAIESILGPNPSYDHHAAHRTAAGAKWQQALHQDAEYDTRFGSFDIQISIFPQDTPREMGGTRFLPGSHFRRVYESEPGRYRNVRGMIQCECEAGTVVLWHHNLWHGAQPNHTDINRYMVKLRLNPTVRQQLLWDTRDLQSPEAMGWLDKTHAWWGVEGRLELMNKIKLWRSLTAQPTFDRAMWWSRIEATPNTLYHRDQYSPLR
jgi:hypothetical protein